MMPLADPLPDNDLLRRLRSGDADALGTLYRKHSAPLYRFALLYCGSSAIAHDVVQDTFIALMDGKVRFDPTQGNLQNYLFGVARNLARAGLGALQRCLPRDDDADDAMPDAAPTPLEKLLKDETVELVRAALLKVPPHYREVLILYEMHGFSYVEAAWACGIDIGTVRSRLHRGRALLARLLTESELIDAALPAASSVEATP
jgi:RNA polymerase sigma-70 factor, ECF subfamily